MNKLKRFLLFIKVYCLLARLDYDLKKNGFHLVFRKYVDRYNTIREDKPLYEKLKGNIVEINRIFMNIEKACTFFPSDAECIHKSLLAYRLLRVTYDLPVDVIVGVRKFPFYAHAWVSLDGHCINDEEQHIKEFKIILSSKGE